MHVEQQLSRMQTEISGLLPRVVSIWHEEDQLARELREIERQIDQYRGKDEANDSEAVEA